MINRKTKRKIGSAAYGTFIVLYVLALAFVIVLVMTQAWQYAEKYEEARPEPVIDAYMEQLSENLYSESLGQTIAAMPHELQSDEEVLTEVRAMLHDELSYRRATGSDEVIHYDLLCGKNKFGEVTLERDGSASRRGNFSMLRSIPALGLSFDADLRPWIITDEEFYFDGLYTSVSITVPRMYTVTLNGVTLGDEYIVERNIPYDVLKDYYNAYPNLPTKVTYQVDDVIGHLEPVVYDEDGNQVVIDDSQSDLQYIQQPDEATMSRLSSFAWDFADRYMGFSAGVSEFTYAYSRVAPYVEDKSDLDERLQMARDGYSWAHTNSYRFDSASLNSAVDVGDNYYVLDITAETTVTYPNKGDNGVVHEYNGLKVIVHDTGSEILAVTVERY